jgi:hypothetical protein
MIKNIKKYWLVGLLVIIALWMGMAKIRYRNVNWEEAVAVITPTVMPTSAPQTNQDYPLWELLPYTGKDYVIDRYVEPGVLVIKTNITNKKIITGEVYKWLIENKVATESHKLVFEKGN